MQEERQRPFEALNITAVKYTEIDILLEDLRIVWNEIVVFQSFSIFILSV